MGYRYIINFTGNIKIDADSEDEAISIFRDWLRAAEGDVTLYSYDCEEIKNNG